MDEYRFTFGFRYRDEPHPNCPWARPEGWLAVIAPNAAIAHTLAHAVIGHTDGPNSPIAYAFSYSPAEWQRPSRDGSPWEKPYILGELARITYEVH